jgi:hypothetical protein
MTITVENAKEILMKDPFYLVKLYEGIKAPVEEKFVLWCREILLNCDDGSYNTYDDVFKDVKFFSIKCFMNYFCPIKLSVHEMNHEIFSAIITYTVLTSEVPESIEQAKNYLKLMRL